MIASPLAVVLSEVSGLDEGQRDSVLSEIERSATLRTGEVAVRQPCPEDARSCAEDVIARRDDIEQVLAIQLLGTPTKLRVILSLTSRAGDQRPQLATIDLRRLGSDADAKAAIDAAMLAIFPNAQRADLASLAPWLVIGASGVAVIAGVVFGLGARSARHELLDAPRTEVRALANRLESSAVAADVLFIAAGIGVASGAALFALQ